MVSEFSLGLTTTAIFVVRVLTLPFIIYNLLWSVKGFWNFVRGTGTSLNMYESMVFFMSLGLLGGTTLAFMGRQISDWAQAPTLFLLCCMAVASGLAAVSKKLALTTQFEKFYWLFKGNNLDIAIRAAQISELDPDYAEEAIDLAETSLAVHLAKKAMKREPS